MKDEPETTADVRPIAILTMVACPGYEALFWMPYTDADSDALAELFPGRGQMVGDTLEITIKGLLAACHLNGMALLFRPVGSCSTKRLQVPE